MALIFLLLIQRVVFEEGLNYVYDCFSDKMSVNTFINKEIIWTKLSTG